MVGGKAGGARPARRMVADGLEFLLGVGPATAFSASRRGVGRSAPGGAFLSGGTGGPRLQVGGLGRLVGGQVRCAPVL